MAENILDILTRQHNEVLSGLSELFQKQTASERGSRNEEYERVQSAFFKHAYGEEQVFYPKLRESMPHIINQAVDEHNIVRNQMRDLNNQWFEEGEWKDRLQVIRSDIQSHVNLEENQIFPEARSRFSEQELETMGRNFLDAEQRAAAEGAAAPSTAEASR